MKSQPPHLSFEVMADLAEGRRSAEERTSLLAHAGACADCSARLTRLQNVLGLIKGDRTEEPPPHVITRALNIFRSRARAPQPSLARRLLATLDFDSLLSAPAFALRAEQARVRHLLFRTGSYGVDLQITPREGKWVVAGQVLGDCGGGLAELRGEGESRSTELTDLCEFTLPAVADGRYSLLVTLAGVEIEVPEFDVRA